MDETELNAIVESCLEGCKMTADNFGLAFCYTGTDETFFYQADNRFYSASLYKLPLCMRYAERIAEGELSWDTGYNTRSIDYLVYRSLVYSDNTTAESLILRDKDFLYGKNPYSLYSGFSEEELAQMRNANDFSPRFMLNTLKTLYEEPERFPRILDYMKEACPGDYFRSILGERYPIAQKYGQMDGVLHTAGIIYTPTPIILVVMCDHMYGQREAIERLAEAMADYSLNMKDSNNSVTRYIAKLSVEQFVQANSPKQRAYNLQAIEMLPLSRAPSPGNPGTGHVGLNGSIWSIADLIDAVKMVDPDFNPKSSKLDDRLAELQAQETPEPLPTATPKPTEAPATPPVTEPPVVESAAKRDGKGLYCVCGAAVLLLCGIIMRRKPK